MKLTRADIIDKLEDHYGVNPNELTKRELAIIGLATRDVSDEDDVVLNNFKASEKPALDLDVANGDNMHRTELRTKLQARYK